MKHDNPDDADSIEKKYQEEKKLRQGAAEAEIAAISKKEYISEEGKAVEKLEWERQTADEVKAVVSSVLQSSSADIKTELVMKPSLDDDDSVLLQSWTPAKKMWTANKRNRRPRMHTKRKSATYDSKAAADGSHHC